MLGAAGTLLLTTPCANRYSLEWVINRVRGGLEPSFDGFGRFATDEPAHLRRLNDVQLREVFAPYGVAFSRILHRSHFFTTLVERFGRRPGVLPKSWKVQAAMLDWHLLRMLPNGATIVALGHKAERGRWSSLSGRQHRNDRTWSSPLRATAPICIVGFEDERISISG